MNNLLSRFGRRKQRRKNAEQQQQQHEESPMTGSSTQHSNVNKQPSKSSLAVSSTTSSEESARAMHTAASFKRRRRRLSKQTSARSSATEPHMQRPPPSLYPSLAKWTGASNSSFDSRSSVSTVETARVRKETTKKLVPLGEYEDISVAPYNCGETGEKGATEENDDHDHQESSEHSNNSDYWVKMALEEASDGFDQDYEHQISQVIAALDKKGNELFEKGLYDQAFQRYERALLLKRRSLQPQSVRHLDRTSVENDEEAEAESAVWAASSHSVNTSQKSILASVATSINNMTYLKQRSGKASAEETMASYLKSLQIKRQILGPDHLSVGKTLNNIGSVFYLKEEYDPALTAYRDAFRIMQANLGPNHLDVGTVISNIGDVYYATGKRELALRHYRSALDIRWGNLGPQDPKVIRLMEKIASLETGKQPQKNQDEISDSEQEEFADEDRKRHRVYLEDVRILQDELEEDMKYFDLVERQMAIDMVKDKTRIFKEMRELYDSDDEQDNQVRPTLPRDSSVRSIDSRISHNLGLMKCGLSNVDRLRALSSVKERLAKLRASRNEELSGNQPLIAQVLPENKVVVALPNETIQSQEPRDHESDNSYNSDATVAPEESVYSATSDQDQVEEEGDNSYNSEKTVAPEESESSEMLDVPIVESNNEVQHGDNIAKDRETLPGDSPQEPSENSYNSEKTLVPDESERSETSEIVQEEKILQPEESENSYNSERTHAPEDSDNSFKTAQSEGEDEFEESMEQEPIPVNILIGEASGGHQNTVILTVTPDGGDYSECNPQSRQVHLITPEKEEKPSYMAPTASFAAKVNAPIQKSSMDGSTHRRSSESNSVATQGKGVSPAIVT